MLNMERQQVIAQAADCTSHNKVLDRRSWTFPALFLLGPRFVPRLVAESDLLATRLRPNVVTTTPLRSRTKLQPGLLRCSSPAMAAKRRSANLKHLGWRVLNPVLK